VIQRVDIVVKRKVESTGFISTHGGDNHSAESFVGVLNDIVSSIPLILNQYGC